MVRRVIGKASVVIDRLPLASCDQAPPRTSRCPELYGCRVRQTCLLAPCATSPNYCSISIRAPVGLRWREISDRIDKGGFPGTANTETIRRMLHGKTVPAHWKTVEAVLLVLCELADRDPDEQFEWYGKDGTRRWHLERFWHRALDEPDYYYGYTSEPPF